MQNIRPVSDLRNKWNDVANVVEESGEPVILTKNGYGNMILFSMEAYKKQQLDQEIYYRLKMAELEEKLTSERIDGIAMMSKLIAELEE